MQSQSALSNLLNKLDALIKVLLWLPNRLLILVMIVLAGSVLTGVILRSCFNLPLAWVEELARYMMVWMTFLGLPVIFEKQELVAVLVLQARLPKPIELFVRRLIHVLVIFTSAVLLYYSAVYTKTTMDSNMISMDFLSMFWVYVAMPISFTLVIIIESKNFLESFIRERNTLAKAEI